VTVGLFIGYLGYLRQRQVVCPDWRYIAYLNWDLIMEIPLSHSFRPSEKVFLGKMDDQAKL